MPEPQIPGWERYMEGLLGMSVSVSATGLGGVDSEARVRLSSTE